MTSRRVEGVGRRNLVISEETDRWLEQLGEDHDLSQTALLNVILLGVRFRGGVDKLIMDGLARADLPIKRRSIPKVWEPAGGGGYIWGEYIMFRKSRGNRSAKPGEGWFVTGPNLGEHYIGDLVREAQITATALVKAAMAMEQMPEPGPVEEPVEESAPDPVETIGLSRECGCGCICQVCENGHQTGPRPHTNECLMHFVSVVLDRRVSHES